jgi:protein SDA1
MQNFMYQMLADSNEIAAKRSLDVMIELYRKKIWDDAKTVNVISTACFSPFAKLLVAALQFFIGEKDLSAEADSDDEKQKGPSIQEVMKKHYSCAGKTRKKEKKLKAAIAKVNKVKEKKERKANFPALELLNDPQDFAEKLFSQVRKSNQRFEVRLMMMNLLSRLIACHRLILPNFYPWLQKYMQPHQQHVTHILAYAAQSCHDLVLPEVIEPMVKQLANQFVVERMSTEIQAFGLNAIREICVRCPLAMTETLLHDLSQYKGARDKGIRMSAKSLIDVYRVLNPNLLRKKDRGRDADLTVQPPQFGAEKVEDGVAGVELLEADEERRAQLGSDAEDDDEAGWEGWETDSEVELEEGDDGQVAKGKKRNGGGKWKDVDENAQLPEDSEDESAEEDSAGEEADADEDGQEEAEDDSENSEPEGNGNEDAEPPMLVDERGRPLKLSPAERAMLLQQLQRSRVQAAAKRQQKQNVRQQKRKAEGDPQLEEDGEEEAEDGEEEDQDDSSAEDDSDEGEEEEDASESKASLASEGVVSTVSSGRIRLDAIRILTDADFERLRVLRAKKEAEGVRGKKRQLDSDESSEEEGNNELVDPTDIMGKFKKARMDKAARVASIMEGREGREKFGVRKKKSATASTTNREKQKSTKNAVMIQHSKRVRGKKKRSTGQVTRGRAAAKQQLIKFKIKRGM